MAEEKIGKHPKKTSEFVVAWIQNYAIVNAIANPSVNIIFDDGYRPAVMGEDPETKGKRFDNLIDWFTEKVTLDILKLVNSTKSELKSFLDSLSRISEKTLRTNVEQAINYGIDMAKFNYINDVKCIPKGEDRKRFNQSLLDDAVFSGEARILGWLYQEWVGENYQPPEPL